MDHTQTASPHALPHTKFDELVGRPKPSPAVPPPPRDLDFVMKMDIPTVNHVRPIAAVLDHASSIKASDVHFVMDNYPWVRQGGTLKPFTHLPRPSMEDIRQIEDTLAGVGESSVVMCGTTRWRMSTFDSMVGFRIAARRIDDEIRPHELLGLPESVLTLTTLNDGLVVIAGGTGSGKSTTLATLVDTINRKRETHILTVENPIEQIFTPKRSLISQRQVIGDQIQALKAALRSDPDVIMVGECRTPDEMKLCLEMAASGHLVFTTLHARDCVTVCDRLIAATGDEGQSMLAQTLRATIGQKLIPDIENKKSRHLAAEVVFVDTAVKNFIGPGGRLSGLRSHLHSTHAGLDWVLKGLVQNNQISQADAMTNAMDPSALAEILGLGTDSTYF